VNYSPNDENGESHAAPVTTPKKRSADSLQAKPKRQRASSPSRMASHSLENPISDHAGSAPSNSEGVAAMFPQEDSPVRLRRPLKENILKEILRSQSEAALLYFLDAAPAKEEAIMTKAEIDIPVEKAEIAEKNAEIATERYKKPERTVDRVKELLRSVYED
jgi:hypothetical protein